jgi:D-beta-D-heptose 7-phosphate kinase/D-beta-D-heptose 1-phosphate adenosyltransferase
VARNIASLGGRVTLLAAVGNDETGRKVDNLANQEQNISALLVPLQDRPTSRKTRFVANIQQLLRADHEDAAPIDKAAETLLCDLLDEEIPKCQVVVLSDYAKGVLTPGVIAHACHTARSHGIRVLVDPKSNDFTRYCGASILTPNAKELAAATGLTASSDTDVANAAIAALRQGAFDALLVTRSHLGMMLATSLTPPLYLPTVAREVYDVSGAGDTVIAAFALALASGSDFAEAAKIANTAAGIAVGKSGTAVVRPDELEHALNAERLRGAEAKIKTADAAADAVTTWRARGLKVGFTNGCFDLVHPGHIALLKQARAACDRLVVGLNTDASVRALKGPNRPVNSEVARAVVLAALESVDAVVLFDEATPLNLIERFRPEVLIKGADYKVEDVVGASFVTRYGGRVHLAALSPGHSTTRIVEHLKRSPGAAAP